MWGLSQIDSDLIANKKSAIQTQLFQTPTLPPHTHSPHRNVSYFEANSFEFMKFQKHIVFYHLILIIILGHEFYYPSFSDKETELWV